MKPIHRVEEQDWRDFVSEIPEGNIYQTPEMARVYGSTLGFEPIPIFVVDRGEIQALALASLIWSGKGLMKNFSTRCILQGGPLCSEPSHVSILLKELDRLTSQRALYVEIRNLWEMKDSIALYQSAGYSFEPHLNYLLDLRGGEEQVLSRMSKGRRKGIAKAERNGLEIVEVESESQIHSFYEIVKKKYSDLGIPLADESLFQSAFKILTPLKEARFLLCRSEGRTIACRGVLLFGKTVYDWYAGSLSGEREKKPDEYLVWNILKWAISGGFETFDFGGAGQPKDDYGPREFKRRFGGEMMEPGRFKKVYKPRQLWISTKAFQVCRRLK